MLEIAVFDKEVTKKQKKN